MNIASTVEKRLNMKPYALEITYKESLHGTKLIVGKVIYSNSKKHITAVARSEYRYALYIGKKIKIYLIDNIENVKYRYDKTGHFAKWVKVN